MPDPKSPIKTVYLAVATLIKIFQRATTGTVMPKHIKPDLLRTLVFIAPRRSVIDATAAQSGKGNSEVISDHLAIDTGQVRLPQVLSQAKHEEIHHAATPLCNCQTSRACAVRASTNSMKSSTDTTHGDF